MNSSSHVVSLAIWDHTPKAIERALRSPRWTGRLTYSRRIEGWVDLGSGYMPKGFTCQQTVSCRATSLIRPNMLSTTPCSHQQFHWFCIISDLFCMLSVHKPSYPSPNWNNIFTDCMRHAAVWRTPCTICVTNRVLRIRYSYKAS